MKLPKFKIGDVVDVGHNYAPRHRAIVMFVSASYCQVKFLAGPQVGETHPRYHHEVRNPKNGLDRVLNGL